MFKKLVYITALSLALASSPDAYSAENYIASDSICINVSNKSIFNNTNCTTNAVNNTAIQSSSAYNNYSLVMNIMSPFLCDAFCKIILKPFSCYECVKYIQHRSESKILNINCTLEKILSSCWTEMAVSLCGLFSIKNGWVWLSSSAIPAILWFGLKCGNNIRYAIDYYRRYENDIDNLSKICNNNNYIQYILDRNIPMDEIMRERKFLFESLINRGKINKLLSEQFNFTQMLEAGVSNDVLLNAVQSNQSDERKLQLAILKYNVKRIATLQGEIMNHNIVAKNALIELIKIIQQNTQENNVVDNDLANELIALKNTIQEINAVDSDLKKELTNIVEYNTQTNNLVLQNNV